MGARPSVGVTVRRTGVPRLPNFSPFLRPRPIRPPSPPCFWPFVTVRRTPHPHEKGERGRLARTGRRPADRPGCSSVRVPSESRPQPKISGSPRKRPMTQSPPEPRPSPIPHLDGSAIERPAGTQEISQGRSPWNLIKIKSCVPQGRRNPSREPPKPHLWIHVPASVFRI